MSAAGHADTPNPLDVLREIVLKVEECDRQIAMAQDVLDHPDDYDIEVKVDAHKAVRRYSRLRGGAVALAAVETLVWRGVLLEEACERMGDRGIEESAPAFRAALAPFVSGKEGGPP